MKKNVKNEENTDKTLSFFWCWHFLKNYIKTKKTLSLSLSVLDKDAKASLII